MAKITDWFSHLCDPSAKVSEDIPIGVIPGSQRETTTASLSGSGAQIAAEIPPLKNIFDRFATSDNEISYTIPHEAISCPYQGPEWSDPSIPEVNLKAIFSATPTLTEANEGIRSQKINRNVTEMVEAILGRYEFMSIGSKIFVYQAPCWTMEDDDALIRRIFTDVKHLFPTDAPFLNDKLRREIVSQIKCHPSTEHRKIFPSVNHNYLCCQDCMYDWHTKERFQHSSSFHRFCALNLNAKDIGTYEGQYWERFLNDLTDGDDALRQRVLEVIGVILTGYPVKNFFFLRGKGNTGKSQLANFIRNILGTSACFALNDISQLGDRWTTGSLWGKLLCLCGDVPSTTLSNKAIGTIKQLTGDDLIRAEIKYQNPFTFENTAKLFFVSNYPLKIPDVQQEQALLDRLVIIPCRNSVPKEDQIPDLYRHLLEESGYIVGLAMDALLDFEKRNSVFTPIDESMAEEMICVADTDQSVMDFVHYCCVLEDGSQCSVSELFEAYCRYESEETLDKTQFSKRLIRCFSGVAKYRTGKERGYKGIRLIDTPSI